MRGKCFIYVMMISRDASIGRGDGAAADVGLDAWEWSGVDDAARVGARRDGEQSGYVNAHVRGGGDGFRGGAWPGHGARLCVLTNQ
mmetsp:Transcript_20019/g.49774  ORF Transcript_20019/g.49774 Transcript_20019/m.49774 type:complete len:86 (+) Transcript_20019:581-838(+)